VITIDAMGCQKKIAEPIKQQGGDYVLSLKGKPGNLHDDVKTFFTSSLSPGCKSGITGTAYQALSPSRPTEEAVTKLLRKHAILWVVLRRMIHRDQSVWGGRMGL
jgi:hypothetical protein